MKLNFNADITLNSSNEKFVFKDVECKILKKQLKNRDVYSRYLTFTVTFNQGFPELSSARIVSVDGIWHSEDLSITFIEGTFKYEIYVYLHGLEYGYRKEADIFMVEVINGIYHKDLEAFGVYQDNVFIMQKHTLSISNSKDYVEIRNIPRNFSIDYCNRRKLQKIFNILMGRRVEIGNIIGFKDGKLVYASFYSPLETSIQCLTNSYCIIKMNKEIKFSKLLKLVKEDFDLMHYFNNINAQQYFEFSFAFCYQMYEAIYKKYKDKLSELITDNFVFPESFNVSKDIQKNKFLELILISLSKKNICDIYSNNLFLNKASNLLSLISDSRHAFFHGNSLSNIQLSKYIEGEKDEYNIELNVMLSMMTLFVILLMYCELNVPIENIDKVNSFYFQY